MQCPSCNIEIIVKNGNPECDNCGAYARINTSNGTVEWMKDGRVFLNKTMEQDALELWKQVYPEAFKE